MKKKFKTVNKKNKNNQLIKIKMIKLAKKLLNVKNNCLKGKEN